MTEAKRWLHYDLAEKLGESPSGSSWQAYDQGHERIVVVRLFKHDSRYDAENANRLTARFSRLCRDDSDRFAEIYFWDVHDHQQYIVREYIPGQSLELSLGAPWPFMRFLPVAKTLARSVDLLHATNVVHGNIHADNVIIADKSESPRLCDAGIPGETHSGDFQNRLLYRAPELIAGRSPSESTDLYALGVLFYRMLTGNYPVELSGEGDTERQLLTCTPDFESPAVLRLPPEEKLLLKRLLAREPSERTRSAEQLITTLGEIELFQRAEITKEEPPYSESKLTPRQYIFISLFILAIGVLYFIVSSLYK